MDCMDRLTMEFGRMTRRGSLQCEGVERGMGMASFMVTNEGEVGGGRGLSIS